MKPKDYEFKFKKKFMSKKNLLLFLIAFFFSDKLFAQTPHINWIPGQAQELWRAHPST